MRLVSGQIARLLGGFLFVTSCLMLPQSTRAEPAVFQIRSLHSEYLVGEAVKLEVRGKTKGDRNL